MIGLLVVLGILLALIYIIMMSMMIIFERDKPKNIIIWSLIFVSTQLVGYIVYILIRQVFYKKKNSLKTKEKEDEIYDKLISNMLVNNYFEINHDVFKFNEMAYGCNTTVNNHYDIFKDRKILINNLIKDISSSKKHVFLELTKINIVDFKEIKTVLIKKANQNVDIRLIYDRFHDSKLFKELKKAGVKVYRYSKYNTVGKVYANLRNVISIDGEIAYLSNLNISSKQLKPKSETSYAFIRLKGDILQDVNIAVHKDSIFASGKFVEYEVGDKHSYINNTVMQYLSNKASSDLELALIKAICMAKKSVQMELSQFIPTESIMSLLRFAINSNIKVRLMVPLKNYSFGTYFASRAYAKELALLGANVYLYDGYINFNAITIDDEYVIFGSFIIDREHINTSPQNLLFIKDNKAVKTFNDIFDSNIDNSYRINNAKFMLLREKFFKNFV